MVPRIRLTALTVVLFTACGGEPDTLEGIKAALEVGMGGYQPTQELARFGRLDLDTTTLPASPTLPDIPPLGYVEPVHPPWRERSLLADLPVPIAILRRAMV